ncbi:MAG: hypothetical protein DRI83_06855 [Bacteroidetes bacterium]|nr:MAG: hypothetical protein DRI83_06855 [Bacteroidota bacterium]
MKKIKLLLIAIIFPAMLFSQGGVEIVPFAGYMFGGSVNYYEGKLKIDNGVNYGVSVLVPVHQLLDIEINYTRMDSKASFSKYAGYPLLENKETTMATNYIQIGGISKFYSQNTKVTPFGSLSIGATWFSPTDGSFQDVWRFSAALGLGVKIMFSDRIGIMLRGRLLMPMYFGGVGVYAGTGGSGVSVNSVVAPLQGDFNGGLIIKIGGN